MWMERMRIFKRRAPDTELRGTYNPFQAAPVGILPVTPPIVEYLAFPHLRGFKRRERRVNNYPDGASAYLFPGAYDPMVTYPGPIAKTMIRKVRSSCKEVWEY